MDEWWFQEYASAISANPHSPAAGLSVIFAKFLYEKQKAEINRKREIFWCTVNPKPGVTYTSFKAVIERLMRRTFMKGCIYVFEQRSKAVPYAGIHCHFLVDKLMSPKQMHNRISDTVKNYIGHSKHVDLRVYPYSYREDKLDYMSGKKWDVEKDDVIKATIDWRDENDIAPIYEA